MPVDIAYAPGCPTGKVITEERVKNILGGTNCPVLSDTRIVCEPEVVEKLMLSLGLGSGGQHITPRNTTRRFTRSTCGAERICPHLTVGKRSVREVQRRQNLRSSTRAEQQPLPDDPTPFDFSEHGARYRRQDTTCPPGGTQYILFVLDTSGSISDRDFNMAINGLRGLVPLFCNPIKVAAMTFDDKYFVEFCFDCFDNSCDGRVEAGAAIANINRNFNRRPGSTHTAGAALCADEYMLSASCGLDASANCIDVVFVTDGKSNDPRLKVCNEIKRLQNRFGVSTYAIGVGSASQNELKCISDSGPANENLFNFSSFQEFKDKLDELVHILSSPDNEMKYLCVNPQNNPNLGTESCKK